MFLLPQSSSGVEGFTQRAPESDRMSAVGARRIVLRTAADCKPPRAPCAYISDDGREDENNFDRRDRRAPRPVAPAQANRLLDSRRGLRLRRRYARPGCPQIPATARG